MIEPVDPFQGGVFHRLQMSPGTAAVDHFGLTVANAVFFGGDVHENGVGHVKADYADARSAVIGTEFCGTSISSRSAANPRTQERLAENPHFVFADSERKGYGVVDITPEKLETTLRVVDDVTRRETRIE